MKTVQSAVKGRRKLLLCSLYNDEGVSDLVHCFCNRQWYSEKDSYVTLGTVRVWQTDSRWYHQQLKHK